MTQLSVPPLAPFAEEQVEVRRHLQALRRSARLIASIVAIVTTSVLALSLVLPDSYQASARIVLADAGAPLGASDAESVKRRLATTNALLGTPGVLGTAAARVPGETRETLVEKVSSSIEQDANIINVVATDGDARRSAAIANAVARAFLAERREFERAQLARAGARLSQEIDRLRGRPDAEAEISAIRERISELGVREASAGAELQIAEEAGVPGKPTSPRPLRYAVLAAFAALFIGVLVALVRDQLTPRLRDSRELSGLLDLRVLTGVPYVRHRLARRKGMLDSAEDEAYQSLRNSLELMLSPTEQRRLLVSSAVHSEGKTTCTARLGRALAQAGHKVLLVSADLRRPGLHEQFAVEPGSGFADVLAALDPDSDDHSATGVGRHELPTSAASVLDEAVTVLIPSAGRKRTGELHLIANGKKPADPAGLLTREAVEAFFEEVRQLDFYDYVFVDAPPLLGIADAHVLAQEVDDLIVVARLDRLTLDNVADLRDVLDRLEVKALGLVAVGVQAQSSPYYMPIRAQAIDGARRSPG